MSMTGDISKTAISALALRVQKLRPLFIYEGQPIQSKRNVTLNAEELNQLDSQHEVTS